MSQEPPVASEAQNVVPLPSWEQMTDLDRGAALLHLHKRRVEGAAYAVEEYPVSYFDHPALLALDDEDACDHAAGLECQGASFNKLGADEYHRLYDMALDAERAA